MAPFIIGSAIDSSHGPDGLPRDEEDRKWRCGHCKRVFHGLKALREHFYAAHRPSMQAGHLNRPANS